MKKILLTTIVLMLFASAEAQPNSGAAVPQPHRPRVGVALSGGGAKGAAHIGVLKYIEELGIPIDYVTGTSMGSIIGGLYALGYSPDEMAALIAGMDWNMYMSNSVSREYQSSASREASGTYLLTVPFDTRQLREESGSLLSSLPSGVISGASLINLFSRLSVGYNDSIDFGTLPVPFACVATDILTGDSVVLRSGNFARAIRSSMAIPGVFSPVEWEGRLLADGGLMNNFPVDVCLDMGAELVIGVELADELLTSPDELRSLPQQLSQYLSIAVRGNRHAHRDMCDVYMHPDITGYGMLSFSAAAIDTLVRRGYECAKSHHDELMLLKKRLEMCDRGEAPARPPRAKNFDALDSVVLSTVTYKGVSAEEQQWLNKKDGLERGVPLAVADIEKAVGILNGTGAFANITYQIFETDEEYWLTHHVYTDALGMESYDLVINLEPSEPHLFAMGLRYDSEESASLLFHAGWNERRLAGFKFGMDLDLNYNFRFGLKGSWCGLGLADINAAYTYHTTSIDWYSDHTLKSWLADHHSMSLYFSEFHLRDFTFAFGLDENFFANRSGFSLDQMLNDETYGLDQTKNFFAVFLRGRYDNMDNAYFATRGMYATGSVGWHKENRLMFSDVDSGFVDASIILKSYLSPTARLTLIPQLAARVVVGKNPTWYDNLAGGYMAGRYLDQQLPFVGLSNPLHTEDLTGILRLDMRYRLADKLYVSLMTNYLASADRLDQPDRLRQVWGAGAQVAYDSPIGPVSLSIHWNDYTRRLGAYVNVGYEF